MDRGGTQIEEANEEWGGGGGGKEGSCVRRRDKRM